MAGVVQNFNVDIQEQIDRPQIYRGPENQLASEGLERAASQAGTARAGDPLNALRYGCPGCQGGGCPSCAGGGGAKAASKASGGGCANGSCGGGGARAGGGLFGGLFGGAKASGGAGSGGGLFGGFFKRLFGIG